ncbi:MAG TPA: LuxR C-terminal-related transcriptional regulator [Streptosporangiaceae bacterium]|jgi:predicted ATPase/DNA-binding CsgD family transcriptional regulator|nr:LuxR C-terminal-related transcriptional regulator [Streptosporangiaceae bacterium]
MELGVHGNTGEDFNAFVGRESEISEVCRIAGTTRALTLCGAGGIGKTRLAIHVAARLAPDFADGAWFIELADVQHPGLVVSRIASATGVVEEPGRSLMATLADALRPRQMLIVLDNCEHVIDACARICQRLLASSPGLAVIATSREPLRVAAETIWQVPPMAMPVQEGHDDANALLSSDALRLFADRAAAAKPGFELGPGNVSAAASICRTVDGLPLGIELAAAWVRVLTVEQIAARLSDRFRLLSSAERTAPARHRTLRSAIDWSHELLSAEERVLVRRLSIFAGWPLAMAEQVCPGPDSDGDLAAGQIFGLLADLADKSLVIADPDATWGSRYRMLDTIRDYAAERLQDAGEVELLRARFRAYTVREVEEAALLGMAITPGTWSDRVQTFRRFEIEGSNLTQALTWCHGAGDPESGLRICIAMRPVWIVQGSFGEGAGWMDAFFELDTSALSDAVRGPALVGRAQLAFAQDPADAAQRAKAGLELCRGRGLEFWAASALNLLAEAALHAGELAEADARATEALAITAESGDRFNESYACGTSAALAAYGGDLNAARRLGERALSLARDIDHQWAAARALLGLGDLARLTGDPAVARQHYEEAFSILREVGARPEMARCLAGIGRIEISQGELELAGQHLVESIELSRSTGSRIGVIRGLDTFAALAIAQGNSDLGVQLAGAAAGLRGRAGLPAAPASRTERLLASVGGLSEATRNQLWEAGLQLSSDAAVELALTVPILLGSREPELTARELEIAALMTRGLSNRSIASELGIASATVARHVANIMAKLGFSSRLQIAAWAKEHGQ